MNKDALAKQGADYYTVVAPGRTHCLVTDRKRRVNQYIIFRGDKVVLGLLRLLQKDIRIQTRVWQHIKTIKHPITNGLSSVLRTLSHRD